MGEYVLNIALDLGSDTLKAAFAYVDDDGAAHCGKLVGDSFSTRVAIPAVARYDENKKEWRYGDDVGRGDAKSFVTVVKIKSLLSLGALYCDLEAALGKPIDLVTVSTLEQKAQMPSEAQFRETVIREMVNIYDAA